VAGEDVKIAVERLHVHPHMRYRLCTVNQHARAIAVRRRSLRRPPSM
jgi:hypothetical protein